MGFAWVRWNYKELRLSPVLFRVENYICRTNMPKELMDDILGHDMSVVPADEHGRCNRQCKSTPPSVPLYCYIGTSLLSKFLQSLVAT